MTLSGVAGGGGRRGARVIAVGVVVAYLALTFYLGSTSQVIAPYAFRAQDKLSHLFVFGGMQWTHLALLEVWFPRAEFRRLRFLAVLSASTAGGLLEVWQAFLPHRSAEMLDLVADSLGAFLFSFAYRKRRFSREETR